MLEGVLMDYTMVKLYSLFSNMSSKGWNLILFSRISTLVRKVENTSLRLMPVY